MARGCLTASRWLDRLTKGSWKGQLEFRKQGNPPGRWAGAFQIHGASVLVAGLAEPVELASARVTLRDDGLLMDRIEAAPAPVEFKGEYRRVTGAERPDQFRIALPPRTSRSSSGSSCPRCGAKRACSPARSGLAAPTLPSGSSTGTRRVRSRSAR